MVANEPGGAGPAGPAGPAVGEFFQDMLRLWGACLNGAAPGGSWPPAGPLRPEDAMRLWAGLAAPWTARAPGDGAGAPAARSIEQVMALMGRAYFAWFSGGLRYGNRAAAIWAETASSLADSVSEASGAENPGEALRVLVDEARAQLRRIADVSLTEARLLQSELEKLASELQGIVDGAAPEGAPNRRWKVKP